MIRPTTKIQRLTLPENSTPSWAFQMNFSPKQVEAIRPLIGFDSMSSNLKYSTSIPKILDYFASFRNNQLISRKLDLQGKSVSYICDSLSQFDALGIIEKIYTNESSLKLEDQTYFKDSLDGKNLKITGWLELDNKFAFFSDNKLYENFKKLIEKYPKN